MKYEGMFCSYCNYIVWFKLMWGSGCRKSITKPLWAVTYYVEIITHIVILRPHFMRNLDILCKNFNEHDFGN